MIIYNVNFASNWLMYKYMSDKIHIKHNIRVRLADIKFLVPPVSEATIHSYNMIGVQGAVKAYSKDELIAFLDNFDKGVSLDYSEIYEKEVGVYKPTKQLVE